MSQTVNVFDKKTETIVISLLYFLLIFGAIWNVTGLFSELMRWMTAPMMATIGALTLLAFPKTMLKKVGIWFGITAIFTIFVEWLGVKTGVIFGSYQYTELLYPQLDSVPMVIGISWAGSCIGAFGLAQKYQRFNSMPTIIKAVIVGYLMMIFDGFLEPVAIKLDYWNWLGDEPPLQNYISWWVIGSVVAYPLIEIAKFFTLNRLAWHSFIAQLIYFSIIIVF